MMSTLKTLNKTSGVPMTGEFQSCTQIVVMIFRPPCPCELLIW